MNFTRTALLSIIIIVIAVTFFGCKGTTKSAAVEIGGNLPLTGSMSFYGVEVKRGIEIFVEMNAPDISFIFEDNNSNVNRSVNIFNLLASREKMPIIISCNSPLSMPLRPLADKNNKVLLALVTGALDFGKENQWSFRDAIRQEPQNIALARHAFKELDYRKGATFVVNDDYGIDGAKIFGEEFTRLGGRIEIQETFTMDQRDMRSSIAKIVNQNVDFVLVVGREASLISAVNQIRESDSQITIFSTNAFESENVYNGIRPHYGNILFTSYIYDLNTKEGEEFVGAFRKKYGNEPSIYAVDSFVAASYLTNIILEYGSNSNDIRDALQNMTFQSQIRGELYFNEHRDIITQIGIYGINEEYDKFLVNRD